MIPVTAPTTGVQRGRGGFYRSADDSPYVTDPSGELVKSGPRKGEVCRLKYGSFSKTGTLIENDVGLTKYKQRNTLLGIGMSVDLVEACRDLVGMEAGSNEFRKAADTIVVEADNLTRSWLAADRGSHGHLICQRCDEGADFDDLIDAGVALGLSETTQRQVAIAWAAMLATNGLEVLAIEASCVDDRWRLAGTLDRIVRCTRQLRFVTTTGEVVVIPAGTVLILDIKFGKCRLAHAIQVAGYRQSVPYDTETEMRGEWQWEISQDHALIAKGDFGDDWPPSIELVWVDLAAGRDHGGECVARAKAWSARDDIFSVTQLDVPGTVQQTSPLTLVDAKAALAKDPEQGADLSGADFGEQWATLQRHYEELDDAARSWIAELLSAATRRNLTFHARHQRTTRVFELYRALISLAAGGGDSDELLRALMQLIVGDVALFPGVEAGHVVGSLGVAEAVTLATFVDQFHAGQMISVVDDDGTMRLTAA